MTIVTLRSAKTNLSDNLYPLDHEKRATSKWTNDHGCNCTADVKVIAIAVRLIYLNLELPIELQVAKPAASKAALFK